MEEASDYDAPRVMTIPAIAVHRLKKCFVVTRPWREALLRPFQREWTTALDGIDLEVRAGEIFGLVGPNGAGKTTLLKILCTQLVPTEGRAGINGHDVIDAPHEVRRALGYCLEAERSFYYRLTGRQNLAFFAALNDLGSQNSRIRIGEALGRVGLEDVADKPFMTYSRGTRQKLALARALLTDASVLLLDEPTSSLDPVAALEFRRLIREHLANQLGKTILLVTHSMEEIDDCCDRAAVMDRGRIVFQGTGVEVRERIRSNGFPGRPVVARP